MSDHHSYIRKMRADGWGAVELPWDFYRGARWRERAIEVTLSPNGRTIWFKSDRGAIYDSKQREEAHWHTWEASPVSLYQCEGTTAAGARCKNSYGRLIKDRSYCVQHWLQAFPSVRINPQGQVLMEALRGSLEGEKT